MKSTLLVDIITVLIPIIVAFVGWGVKRAVNYLDAKTKLLDETKDVKRKEFLKWRVSEIAVTAVRATMQTYVDGLKKSKGAKLTSEEAANARHMAYEKAKNILVSEGIAVAKGVLDTNLEAAVHMVKPIKNF